MCSINRACMAHSVQHLGLVHVLPTWSLILSAQMLRPTKRWPNQDALDDRSGALAVGSDRFFGRVALDLGVGDG
jgi:hypothetical protein